MTTLTVYVYDNSGYFLYPLDAYPNPESPGDFIYPANSTTTPPPTYTYVQIPQFILSGVNVGTWTLVSNYVGSTWYNSTTGNPVLITQYGQSLVGLQQVNSNITSPTPLPIVNINEFITELNVALGGALLANVIYKLYPALIPWIMIGDYADATLLIEDVKANNLITLAQYNAIQTALTSNNIPITLPTLSA